jgi:hypothetical protein
MAKLLAEPQTRFIKFWLKSTQAGLKVMFSKNYEKLTRMQEEDRNERDEWTKTNFWDNKVKEHDKTNLTTIEEQHQKIQKDLKVTHNH